MLKRTTRKISLGLFLAAIFFIFNSQVNITGAAIGVSFSSTINAIISLLLILTAIIIFTVGEEKGLVILISGKAIKRSKKDKRIRHDIKRYRDEISLIASNPSERPKELIGDFRISPRGGSKGGIRVAWHYDKQNNRLYIDDLLYHTDGKTYVDKWNKKAKTGEIKLTDYQEVGYQHYASQF